MGSIYYATVSIHVLAAMLWIGGIFFFALVGAPVVRTVDSALVRRQLFERMGLKFRLLGWVAVGTLLATGVINLGLRGMLEVQVLTSAAFWTTPYGRSLAVKLIAVTIMLGLSAWHDFWLGPHSLRLETGTRQALAARRRASRVARMTGVTGLIVILAAVRLARGG